MSEEFMTVNKKIFDLKASIDEIKFLSINNSYLAPCSLKQDDDTVSFQFNIGGLYRSEDICKNNGDRYRYLFNCSELYFINSEFCFSMNPQNLMCDLNLMPKVLVRDKCDKNTDFLLKYKSLSATMLYPKYTYDDYVNGGYDLFKKSGELREIYDCTDVDELKQWFLNRYVRYHEEENRTKISVNKKQAATMKIAIPILVLVVLFFAVIALFAYVKELPDKDSYLLADNEYLSGNYIEVQEILSKFEVEDLPFTQRFILARSYVSSESMTQLQKTNVLEGITVNTDESVINYWIYVGRLEFDKAVDLAQKIGDDELLLYAYMKQRSVLEDDVTLAGREKIEKINDLEERIESIINEVLDSDSYTYNTQSKAGSSYTGDSTMSSASASDFYENISSDARSAKTNSIDNKDNQTDTAIERKSVSSHSAGSSN